eukprot:8109300-Pyramimonas_sp.AAC.1
MSGLIVKYVLLARSNAATVLDNTAIVLGNTPLPLPMWLGLPPFSFTSPTWSFIYLTHLAHALPGQPQQLAHVHRAADGLTR